MQTTTPRWLLLTVYMLSFHTAVIPQASPSPSPVEQRLSTMTLQQKVGQMFMVVLFGNPMNAPSREFLTTWQPGALVLFEQHVASPSAITALTNDYQQTLIATGGLPALIATDQEGGIIQRLKNGFTTFPAAMLVAAAGDDLAYQTGVALATELRAVGVNFNLAPVADLNTNPDNPVIGRRSYGSDPQIVAQTISAVIQGLNAGGVGAVVKHFPGHGDTISDSHTSLPVLGADLAALQARELVPFRAAIEAKVGAVMLAHIWFPLLDDTPNLPSSLSAPIVTGLLREQMAYAGVIMTDAIEMDAIDTVYGYDEAALLAILAGNDLVVFGAHTSLETQAHTMQAVLDAARTGVISEARLDESVRRILELKARYGLLDPDAWQPLDASPAATNARLQLEAHQQLVEDLFRSGITVMRNDRQHIPFNAESKLVIVYPANRPQIQQTCAKYHRSIHWIAVNDSPSSEQIAWAAHAGSRADSIVVFTQNAQRDPTQQTLVKSFDPAKTVVVALQSPYDWRALPEVAGYITTYSPLTPASTAACEVLFGVIPAAGRSPIIW